MNIIYHYINYSGHHAVSSQFTHEAKSAAKARRKSNWSQPRPDRKQRWRMRRLSLAPKWIWRLSISWDNSRRLWKRVIFSRVAAHILMLNNLQGRIHANNFPWLELAQFITSCTQQSLKPSRTGIGCLAGWPAISLPAAGQGTPWCNLGSVSRKASGQE